MSRGGGGGHSGGSSSHGGGSSHMHSSSGGHSRGYSSPSRGSSYNYGGGYRGGPHYHTHYSHYDDYGPRYVCRRPLGCFSEFFCSVAALIIVLIIVFVVNSGDMDSVQKSTMERHPIAASQCEKISEWYEDNMSDKWIHNSSTLINGLDHFYDKTGIQPYVVIVESIDGIDGCPTDTEFTNYLKDVYDDKMPDGGHLVIGVFDNSAFYPDDYDWGFGCYAGKDAEAVMDTEAREILIDYLEHYYTMDNLTDEEFLAKAVSDTGDKIMTVDKIKSSNVKTIVVVLASLAAVIAVVIFFIRRKKLKAEQAKADAAILNSNLDSLSGSDTLKDKYSVDADKKE